MWRPCFSRTLGRAVPLNTGMGGDVAGVNVGQLQSTPTQRSCEPVPDASVLAVTRASHSADALRCKCAQMQICTCRCWVRHGRIVTTGLADTTCLLVERVDKMFLQLFETTWHLIDVCTAMLHSKLPAQVWTVINTRASDSCTKPVHGSMAAAGHDVISSLYHLTERLAVAVPLENARIHVCMGQDRH